MADLLNIDGYVDMLQLKDRCVRIHDYDMWNRINASSLDDNYFTIPTSGVVYKEILQQAEQINSIAAKQTTLTAGTGISIENNIISSTVTEPDLSSYASLTYVNEKIDAINAKLAELEQLITGTDSETTGTENLHTMEKSYFSRGKE